MLCNSVRYGLGNWCIVAPQAGSVDRIAPLHSLTLTASCAAHGTGTVSALLLLALFMDAHSWNRINEQLLCSCERESAECCVTSSRQMS